MVIWFWSRCVNLRSKMMIPNKFFGALYYKPDADSRLKHTNVYVFHNYISIFLLQAVYLFIVLRVWAVLLHLFSHIWCSTKRFRCRRRLLWWARNETFIQMMGFLNNCVGYITNYLSRKPNHKVKTHWRIPRLHDWRIPAINRYFITESTFQWRHGDAFRITWPFCGECIGHR